MTNRFVPPAATGLPLPALDSATEGANALDAFAVTPSGQNLLAHALVQLARDGWLRAEPGEGFEPVRDRDDVPQPEDPSGVAPATHQTEPELTAEEARDLADDLGTQLYRAQDALAFVEECCVIADREQKPVTTADVREWLKGARCGRQLAADRADEAGRRARYVAAIRDTDGWVLDDGQHMLDAVMAVADAEQAELRRERDLAIAHDQQPYPTAWAYEQACKALRRKTEAIERTLEWAAGLDGVARELAGPDAVHPVAAHIRHLLDTTAADEAQQQPDTETRPGCHDPIECRHEAALGQAEEKLDAVHALGTAWSRPSMSAPTRRAGEHLLRLLGEPAPEQQPGAVPGRAADDTQAEASP